MRAAVAVVLLVGCFEPVVPMGVPCSASGECPLGQQCDRPRNVCGSLPTDAAPDDGTDAPIDAAPIDAGALGPWGAVLPITQLNTTSAETDPAISPDGLELVFSSNRPGGAGGFDLWVARRANAMLAFDAPIPIPELSTALDETGAHLTVDRLTIYFMRNDDIYRATRPDRASMFGAPVVDIALSSAMPDFNPALSPDGLTACVTRGITAADRDLYLFTRASLASPWSAGEAMTTLQTALNDSGAEFTADPLELYFHSNRGIFLGIDIYRATRASTSDPFTAPTPVTELNSNVAETDASITADRRLIMFNRGGDLVYSTR